ncbi:alpha/beta fold hydrolase [Streptomyces sp. ISL-11]|uniref:alpha/beta fold hydrolase n=1 Tax=Streptomyces sp. ISL-11 TaxID=2819174 RepID=UPI001BE576F0|nr:alpha/beta hydrolase [Streptomyces sp. ISL-11]MBT2385290.1 alpha/beta hydrolase [Streptomyces sp. ISL-11]
MSTLYYEIGAGPPVLLLPGLAENARSWWRIMQDLALTNRTLALVLPGLGGTSPVHDVRPDHLASFVAAFLDAVEVEEVTLVGHSFGGAVAAYLTLTYPHRVTRLALVDAAGLGRAINPLLIASSLIPARVADVLSTAATLPGFGALATLSGALLLQQPWRVPPLTWLSQMRLSRSRTPLRTSIEVLRQGTGLTGQDPRLIVTGRLKDIEVPALVVWGLTDWLLPVSQGVRAARKLPNGKLTVIPGAGHVSFVDCHEDFMGALGPFVRDDISRLRRTPSHGEGPGTGISSP